MKKFDTTWLNNIPPEDRESTKNLILSHKKTLDILRELVYNMITSTERVTEKDYDSPSWSHKQAHYNGSTEALQRVMRLLEFDENY